MLNNNASECMTSFLLAGALISVSLLFLLKFLIEFEFSSNDVISYLKKLLFNLS